MRKAELAHAVGTEVSEDQAPHRRLGLPHAISSQKKNLTSNRQQNTRMIFSPEILRNVDAHYLPNISTLSPVSFGMPHFSFVKRAHHKNKGNLQSLESSNECS